MRALQGATHRPRQASEINHANKTTLRQKLSMKKICVLLIILRAQFSVAANPPYDRVLEVFVPDDDSYCLIYALTPDPRQRMRTTHKVFQLCAAKIADLPRGLRDVFGTNRFLRLSVGGGKRGEVQTIKQLLPYIRTQGSGTQLPHSAPLAPIAYYATPNFTKAQGRGTFHQADLSGTTYRYTPRNSSFTCFCNKLPSQDVINFLENQVNTTVGVPVAMRIKNETGNLPTGMFAGILPLRFITHFLPGTRLVQANRAAIAPAQPLPPPPLPPPNQHAQVPIAAQPPSNRQRWHPGPADHFEEASRLRRERRRAALRLSEGYWHHQLNPHNIRRDDD